MTEIIPAILPKSYEELEAKLDIVAGHVPTVQIDICDGAYVPNRTWPYLKGVDTIFESIVDQEKALPHWEELDFEFDLMVKSPLEKIPDFISAGASRLIVHKSSCSDEELSAIIAAYGKHSDELGPFDVELGIALRPTDTAESIADIVSKIHFVQVMGIDKEGFQGQPIDKASIALIKALKSLYKAIPVAVDGAVGMDTARAFIEAGADRLVVGSTLFRSDDFLNTLVQFRAL